VQALLVERLSSGEPDPEAVARALGMSLRSLQRRLEDEGTSFKEVLAATRRELACDYLQGGRTSVTEVTFLLGFADTSSFARAFRRWTGESPSEWRERAAQAETGGPSGVRERHL
jgi:AraC-like DNA-binding protein